jgi:dolichol-phosphate mannosyltransferase
MTVSHTTTPTSLSFVIPVLDEAESICKLVEEILGCQGLDTRYEIIVVDDGSTDDTIARLTELRKQQSAPLRLIRHRANAGQSAAIWTGVAAARHEWIVTLDGDGQNDPADLPKLLAELDARNTTGDLHLICGHRRKRQDSWMKRISSRIANWVRSRLLGDATPDTGCGLKIIRRDAFLALPFFDHMHRFLPALIQRGGGRIVSVPVNHRPRTRGLSKYGLGNRLWVGIIDLLGVIWLQRRAKNPIKDEV